MAWAGLALASIAAPAGAAPAPAYHAPRTALGQPDLQGFWTSASLTTLEREAGAPLIFATLAQEDAYVRTALAEWRQGEAGGLGQDVSEWRPKFGFARIAGLLERLRGQKFLPPCLTLTSTQQPDSNAM